ncbi:MAG: NTP transferase domain-containing protein, partial [Sphingomonas sp.]
VIAPERTLLVLLAAGQSTRFGLSDKLVAPLGGKPLYRHAADTLAAVPFLGRVVISSDRDPVLGVDGFDSIVNEAPERGLSSSLVLGVGAAQRLGAAAILVALADMPFVTSAHVCALFAAADGPAAMVASAIDDRAMPPALFAAGRFADLAGSSGDQGARALLGAATLVAATAHELSDIDTPDDLARAQMWLAAPAQ